MICVEEIGRYRAWREWKCGVMNPEAGGVYHRWYDGRALSACASMHSPPPPLLQALIPHPHPSILLCYYLLTLLTHSQVPAHLVSLIALLLRSAWEVMCVVREVIELCEVKSCGYECKDCVFSSDIIIFFYVNHNKRMR